MQSDFKEMLCQSYVIFAVQCLTVFTGNDRHVFQNMVYVILITFVFLRGLGAVWEHNEQVESLVIELKFQIFYLTKSMKAHWQECQPPFTAINLLFCFIQRACQSAWPMSYFSFTLQIHVRSSKGQSLLKSYVLTQCRYAWDFFTLTLEITHLQTSKLVIFVGNFC